MNKTFRFALTALATSLLLAACGGGGSSAGTGVVSLDVTDAPVDAADAVVIQFTGVALKRAGSEEKVINFDAPRTLDLLALHGGKTAVLLQDVTVESGDYEWVRLLVTSERNTLDSYLTETGGTQVPLFVPSGSQSGLKLVSGFTVPQDGKVAFTIDFDLRKSVAAPQAAGSPYLLKPALRLVDNAQAGAIGGTVASATLADASCPSATAADNANVVYVFPGIATPNDLGGDGPDAVTTAAASVDTSGTWRYQAAFLQPGTYTVAFTCQAANDAPEAGGEPIVFLGARTVTVNAGATTTADF